MKQKMICIGIISMFFIASLPAIMSAPETSVTKSEKSEDIIKIYVKIERDWKYFWFKVKICDDWINESEAVEGEYGPYVPRPFGTYTIEYSIPSSMTDVPVKIQLWESDPNKNYGRTMYWDLDEKHPDKDIDIVYNVDSGRWDGDDYPGDYSGYGLCGLYFVVTQEKYINDVTPPQIEIKSPLFGYLYINGKKVMPTRNLWKLIVIGPIKCEPIISDDSSGISVVEVTVKHKVKTVIETEPYSWILDERSFGREFLVGFVAFDYAGNQGYRGVLVTKLFNL